MSKQVFRDGDSVTVTDTYGASARGVLHLPDIRYTGGMTQAQMTHGGYGVHTIILPDGTKFRTEGRLSRA